MSSYVSEILIAREMRNPVDEVRLALKCCPENSGDLRCEDCPYGYLDESGDGVPFWSCDEEHIMKAAERLLGRLEDNNAELKEKHEITACWIVRDGRIHCSNCDEQPITKMTYKNTVLWEAVKNAHGYVKYCPDCGARMIAYEEKEKENKDVEQI